MNAKATSSSITTKVEVTLSRDLSLFTITMIGVGGMIGAGIFVLTGSAAGMAGPALVRVFLLNCIATRFTAFSYAELGSTFPGAGGGYLWVKKGLGSTTGFLSGWMDWFANTLVNSLYALGFGRFAAELWGYSGLTTFGLSVNQMRLFLMILVILVFTNINYLGASETGKFGNIVTLSKVAILSLFVLFGVLAMLRTDAWHTRFTTGFMPNGFYGIFVAMSLTFIAFEDYEIIAQYGEEAIYPKRNIPRAIFCPLHWLLSSICWQESPPMQPPIHPRVFRRDHILPDNFTPLHPRRHTPHWAVILSGGLMLILAWIHQLSRKNFRTCHRSNRR